MSLKQSNIYSVILAGGSGTRFWPKSRQKFPKQLCRIADPHREMILTTIDRIAEEIPASRLAIVTHRDQTMETKKIVGSAVDQIIAEPLAKNTLPALVLAALDIKTRHGDDDAIMISLHADAVIHDNDKFLQSLNLAVKNAADDKLVLVGIKPTSPETGYGYIERDTAVPGYDSSFFVKRFREKPDLPTAQSFLDAGGFYWNSGIFVWRVQTFLAAVERYAPETLQILAPVFANGSLDASRLEVAYEKLEKTSVDDAILEKTKNIVVVEATFGWQDVGSWGALDELLEPDDSGNRTVGDAVVLNCKNTTVDSDGPLICALDVEDLVIVHHKGAILVCPKSRSQDVKKIVAELERQGRTEYI